MNQNLFVFGSTRNSTVPALTYPAFLAALIAASCMSFKHIGRQIGRGDLQQLLVPALDGAVPGAEVDGIAVGVGQDLHFDVPRRFHALFDIDAVVVKGRQGLGPGHGQLGPQLGLVFDLPDAAAASRRRMP